LKLPPIAGWPTQTSFVEEKKTKRKPMRKRKGKKRREIK